MPALLTSVGLLSRPDPQESFCFPSHIEAAGIAALPSRPGVYLLLDACSRPLYVGKSVNIRSRVLAHLRNPAEARLLQQTCRIDFQRTAGEIGALLLESRLIKDLQPQFNKKLRRAREMCAWRLDEAGTPALAYGRDLDFSRTPSLYGLFATRRAAQEKLQEIVDAHRLCPAVCGLEKRPAGRPCFAHQLGRCLGACIGTETAAEHAQRLADALASVRVATWPYEGAVGIVEESDGWRQTHVVDHWFYLGSFDSTSAGLAADAFPAAGPRFDIDTYQILVRPLLAGQLAVQPVAISRARTSARRPRRSPGPTSR